MLGSKVLKLELLDESRQLIPRARATGFVLNDPDGLHLYTCWHVVTGVDFMRPSPKEPPLRRAFVRICHQDVEEHSAGVRVIGGSETTVIPLYDESEQFLWQQEPNNREQPDLDSLGIRVPKFVDLVRIRIALDPLVQDTASFDASDVHLNLLLMGTDVYIAGYPYGYSALGLFSPEPIFLKRAIASARTPSAAMILLDGGGAPAMSGAPILIPEAGRWQISGVYGGIIFPDHLNGPEGARNDRSAALGIMVPLWIARAFLGVPRA
ncbi:MAG: hypothetical protein WD076_05810 [Parvularculaceae bacterium]